MQDYVLDAASHLSFKVAHDFMRNTSRQIRLPSGYLDLMIDSTKIHLTKQVTFPEFNVANEIFAQGMGTASFAANRKSLS